MNSLLVVVVCACWLQNAAALKVPNSGAARYSRPRVESRLQAATEEQVKSGLGWDSHKAIDAIPDSLVRTIDGNESMRRKFEALCRNAQASICKAIEDLDGEGKFRSDAWVRENGGGGISRVLSGGKVFEKVRTAPHRTAPTAVEHARRAARGLAFCCRRSWVFTRPFPPSPLQAGVNLSVVYGTMPQEALKAATERGVDRAKVGPQHQPSQLAIVPSPPPRPSPQSMTCGIRAWPPVSASRSSPAACRR